MAGSVVEQELWNIFTFYTLHGKSGNPEQMMPLDLYRLCRDCQLCEQAMYSRAICQQDIHIICASEIKKRSAKLEKNVQSGAMSKKGAFVKALSYGEFLNVLTRLARKLYPEAGSLNDSFQQLLMENVLPFAHRRSTQSIETHLGSDKVRRLEGLFADALLEVYKFYAAEAQKDDNRAQVRSVSARNFDEMNELTQTARTARRANAAGSLTSEDYSATKPLSFQMWIKWCSDFGLSSTALLTQVEVGDVYLACVAVDSTGGDAMRKMRFSQVWEAMVRLALTAYRTATGISTANKIKGLFVYMWKHIQDTVVNKGSAREVNGNDAARYMRNLAQAAEKLANRTLEIWGKQGYPEYLAPPQEVKMSATGMLQTMGSPSRDAQAAEPASPGAASAEEVGGARSSAAPPPPSVELVDDQGGDLGDDRIDVDQLRLLLERKPEMGRFLREALVRAGLASS